jgi:SRSO17 transposase
MDPDMIRALESALREYVDRFADCFPRRDTRAQFPRYVEGPLSDLERKSVEPMALSMNGPVRTLPEFLSQHKWDQELMRDRLQQMIRDEQGGDGSRGETIGIIDETSAVKKGRKTPGVQRQHCGAVGKKENGIVLVNLAFARGDFHCLLDGELFLPESWPDDRRRCEEAGIPNDMVYRPKSEIALEPYQKAKANGLVFDWLTFDEWYGSKPAFLRALDAAKQNFIGEVLKSFRGWLDPPEVTFRPYRKGQRGRGRKTPRLKAGSRKPRTVEEMVRRHPVFQNRDWECWQIKETRKGPIVWEVKPVLVTVKDADGLPGPISHLLVARNVIHPEEIKDFIGNAPLDTPLETLLRVAFSRWRIERCYQDQKGEVGMDHYEGRRYQGLKRHLILSCVSYLFLSIVRESQRGGKFGADGVPSPHSRLGDCSLVVA